MIKITVECEKCSTVWKSKKEKPCCPRNHRNPTKVKPYLPEITTAEGWFQ